MWLLGVDDYKLVHVLNPEKTRYAILSHTWGTGEVTFDDIQCLDVARTRPAWDKVQQTCRIARERGLSLVWIDTCCIDKRSSAELSEAINSMFAWYRGAAECYAYLADYDTTDDPTIRNMAQCRWFSRGWTLQELIAPKLLYFYDYTWTLRGDKISLSMQLSEITNISIRALAYAGDLYAIPVARRMCWAAGRQTTRPEDLAYCLLGIFGVNMPLIYGEGANAFLRLQEAIALATEDLSLFAWFEPDTSEVEAPRYSGILARSPSQFAGCHNLLNTKNRFDYDSGTFVMVNHCLRFQTYLMTDAGNGEFLMPLHCSIRDPGMKRMLVLRLIKTGTGFVRHKMDRAATVHAKPDFMDPASWDSHPRTLTIPKVLRHGDLHSIRRRFHGAFHFRVSICGDWEHELSATVPDLWKETPGETHWDASTGRYPVSNYSTFAGMLTGTIYKKRDFGLEKHAQFLIFFGFAGNTLIRDNGFERRPWIALSRSHAESPIETFNPRTHLFDLPRSVLAQQHRMDYFRFTSNARRYYREELYPSSTRVKLFHAEEKAPYAADCYRTPEARVVAEEKDWPHEDGREIFGGRRLRTSLPYAALDVAIFARLETLRVRDYTTHRVHITIQRISDMPPPQQQTVHVFDADGQPHTLPEHHQDPDCPRGDGTHPPGASSPEPLPEPPLGPQAADPAPPNSEGFVPAADTPDTPQDQAAHTGTTSRTTTQTSPPSPLSALPLPLRPPPTLWTPRHRRTSTGMDSMEKDELH